MKYLIIILVILSAATIATFVALWPQQQKTSGDTIVTINDSALTRQDIQDYKDKDLCPGDDEDFINEMITRKLLIAEAQRRNIDREPDFRRALKTFYEHSLIKTLMERVNRDIAIEVSDEEVDAYLDDFGKTFIFYTLKSSGNITAETMKSKGDKYTSAFDDLSGQLQQTLAAMQPGDIATTFVTGNENIAVYLERIEGQTEHQAGLDREDIRRQLHQAKVEKHINKWIKELREQASITYHQTQE